MNEITTMLNGEYEPVQALMIYKWPQKSKYYIESHPIQDGTIGAGKPLQADTIADLVQYFQDRQLRDVRLSGVVPAELLYANWNTNTKALIWYNEPKIRPMFFTKDLGIPSGSAMQPGLVYVLEEKQLSVFAYCGYGRPALDQQLFRAPYHNVNDRGGVCLGNAKVKRPENTYEAIIAHYEQLFWGSEFSHLQGDESPASANINTYWKQAVAHPRRAFNESILKPSEYNKTIKEIIKSLR